MLYPGSVVPLAMFVMFICGSFSWFFYQSVFLSDFTYMFQLIFVWFVQCQHCVYLHHCWSIVNVLCAMICVCVPEECTKKYSPQGNISIHSLGSRGSVMDYKIIWDHTFRCSQLIPRNTLHTVRWKLRVLKSILLFGTFSSTCLWIKTRGKAAV